MTPDPEETEDPENIQSEIPEYKLPPANNFEEVNQNFDTISDTITSIVQAMQKHSEATNENLIGLATEVSQNLEKLEENIKSMLSSQHMVFVLVVLVLGVFGVIIAGIFKALVTFFLS